MTSTPSPFADEIIIKPPRDWVLVGLWISLVVVALIWIAPFVFIVFTSL